jgi:asparagine synthase (glutamine-hydrolysing)
MCGIAGICRPDTITPWDLALVRKINEIQAHRGPDDQGIFSDDFCVLGHRRLSIIDLSKDGHQPFCSDDGRYQMVYNGEIYNYIEIRSELESHGWCFHTRTDTEVLLKSYIHYGKECLYRFNGMFAFAVYDHKLKSIFLARDRVGIKPLYYVIRDRAIYFASEIKGLRHVPDLSVTVNTQSLFDFLVFNRTDVFDETFLNEIKRIPNGHYAIYTEQGLKLTQWWDPETYLKKDPLTDIGQATSCVHDLLASAVRLRMRSDVTVGSCLSGGLDSSIILGLLFEQNMAAEGYQTFTASFPGDPVDETVYTKDLNTRYPFKPYLTFPSAETAYQSLQQFVHANDEPTTNPSFFSQYEVMKKAAQSGVKVLLDGQGGDEVFAGYQYFHGFNLYGLLTGRRGKEFIKELINSIIRKQHFSAYQTLLFQLLPRAMKKKMLLTNMPYISHEFFHTFIETSLVFNEFFTAETMNISLVRHIQYKLEHLLRMEDRNSMAFSIEARVPYLDHRLVEFMLGVCSRLKIRDGETKFLQKAALSHYTTARIVERKDKIGFGTPGEKWMKTPAWLKLTQENLDYVGQHFKGVLKKDPQLPYKGFDRWKINQLAVWHQMVTGNYD